MKIIEVPYSKKVQSIIDSMVNILAIYGIAMNSQKYLSCRFEQLNQGLEEGFNWFRGKME